MEQGNKDPYTTARHFQSMGDQISFPLDLLCEIFRFAILTSEYAKGEWMNWRLTSSRMKERVDPVFLKTIGHECVSIPALVAVPHLFNAVKIVEGRLCLGTEGMKELKERISGGAYSAGDIISEYSEQGGLKEVIDCIVNHSNITSLDLSENRVSENEELFARLEGNRSITHLKVVWWGLMGSAGLEAFFPLLKNNNTITSLDLGYCGYHTVKLDEIRMFLNHNTSLKSLGLRGGGVEDQTIEDLSVLFDLIRRGTLTSLDLNSFKLDLEMVSHLAVCLESSTNVISLNLGRNHIGVLGLEKLIPFFQKNHSLTCLGLGSNDLLNEGVIKLLGSIEKNSNISTLKIGNNGLDYVGYTQLATFAKQHPSLTSLHLGYLESEEFIYVLQMLEGTRIKLHAKLEDPDVEEIATCLSEATILESLTITVWPPISLNLIFSSLKKNASLTLLEMSWDSSEMEGLIDLIRESRTITHLIFIGSEFDLDQMKCLAKGLQERETHTPFLIQFPEIQFTKKEIIDLFGS